jgi:hypothetical protein
MHQLRPILQVAERPGGSAAARSAVRCKRGLGSGPVPMSCLLLLHEILTRQANVAAKPTFRRIATVLAQTASDLRV